MNCSRCYLASSRKLARFTIAVAALVLVCTISAGAELRLAFRSEQRGGPVSPQIVLVDGSDVSALLESNTLISTATEGIHQVLAIAKGYFILEASALTTITGDPYVLNFEAERETPIAELTAGSLRVYVNVISKQSCEPLSGTLIAIPELKLKGMTDERGEFCSSKSSAETTEPILVRVEASKVGYESAERTDVPLAQQAVTSVRLTLNRMIAQPPSSSSEALDSTEPLPIAINWGYTIRAGNI